MLRDLRPDWEVKSCATNKKSGRPMAKLMRELMTKHGFDPSEHRSTAISPELVKWAQLIIGFQPSHIKSIGENGGFAHLLTEWFPPQLKNYKKVPDPHFDTTGKTHELVFDMLTKTLHRIERTI